MRLYALLLLLASLSLAFAVPPGQAAQVQLAWDARLQADGTPYATLTGYKLYYGSSSHDYQTVIPMGTATIHTVTNLAPGQTYYFAVTALATNEESTFSNELSVTLPPDNTPNSATIPQQQIRVVSVNSEDLAGGNYAAVNALDGRPDTMWVTEWYLRAPTHPHTLVLDLGDQYQVDGFRYLPRQDGNANGTIAAYEFYVSADGVSWGTPAATGTLAADTTEKTVQFAATGGRFVRLVARSEINGLPYTSIAELNIFGTPMPTPTPRDTDNDGLSDEQEQLLGTNPQVADTDGDGLTDGAEVITHGTDPLRADTDGDGASDGAEVAAGTDPLTPEEMDAPVLGAWTFEEGRGTIAHDTSGNGFDGTLSGTTRWVSGKVGLALQFNGTNSAVRIPPLNITTDTLTLMAWVRGNPMASWAGILYARHATQSIGMHYYSNTRQLAYTWNNNSAATWNWSGGPVIPANEWALVAVSIEPTKAVLYVVSQSTGMQARTNTIPHQMQSLNTEFFLARDALSDGNRRFRGTLDDVRIFHGALTAEDIQAIYDSER